MSKITLQVPVDRSLKLSAEKVVAEYGFSSLQEAIRVFMAQIAKKALAISFSPVTPDEVLTSKQETLLTREYKEARREIDAGKGITASSVEEMISQLRS